MENNKGWIRLHRQIMETPEWLAEPFTRGQAWVDLLLLANHKTGHIRKRGILIAVDRGQVGYSEESLTGRWQWSRGKVRRFLSELQRREQIMRKPAQILQCGIISKLSEKTVQKKTSVSNLIYIINYDKYQMNGTEDDTEDGRKTVQEQRMKKMKRKPPVDFSDISLLEERYSDIDLINQCFKTISSTRKANRISDNVKLSILQQWNKYPADQVMSAIRIYLEKDYAAQGKGEKYLMGIIRGNAQQKPAANISGGKVMKRTGSLLDKVYQEQGFTLI
jgi:hypothetical protein